MEITYKMKDYYFVCHKCGRKVNVLEQIIDLFDSETGESEFESEFGVTFHMITCPHCNSQWIMSLKPV